MHEPQPTGDDDYRQVDDPDLDRKIEYTESLARYREHGGRDMEACVAAVVSAAMLLVDPCDVLWMGLDPEVAYVYDSAASRIWEGVCRGLVESAVLSAVHERGLDPDDVMLGAGQADVFGFVPLPVVADIVHRSLSVEFTDRDRLDPVEAVAVGEAFDRIVSAEFGPIATVRLPDFPKGDEIARLVSQRVGSYPFALLR